MGLLSVAGVQVDIKGNLQPLRRDLQAAERELGAFARGVSGTGTGMQGGSFNAANTTASGFFSTLRSGAQDIFFMTNAAQQMYSAFAKPFKAADDLAQLGYEAERARIALTNTLGSAEEYEKWMRAIKDATHGTITETEAAGMAYQVLRLGLATTADEAREFVRMATIIGHASPQLTGASDAIGEISLTIANMSWRRLDQLGLSVSEVKARMEELRTLNGEMTTEEAFQAAVLEGLTEQANTLGDELLEVGAATQRWKVVWQDIKTDIGWKIGEGFDGAIVAAEGLQELLRVMTQEPWKLQFVLGGLPDWVVNAMQAGTTGKGDITNQYDDVLGRQQSQIRGGMSPALAGGALAPSGVPPVAIPNLTDLAALEQAQLAGFIVPPELLVDIERYYEEYYAAQERAQTAAFQRAREQFENRLLRMYGTGGGLDTMMIVSGLLLKGAQLDPSVKQSIDDYYNAYYAAQERALTRALSQYEQRTRGIITQIVPGRDYRTGGHLPLPTDLFPRSAYSAMMTQHGMPGTQFFPEGLGLPTDRSGRPSGYQDWYWQQYYTQGGWQGGDTQPWQIDPATRRTREQLEANRARREEMRRLEQMRAFREADAGSMRDVYPGGGGGRFAGLGAFMGVAEGLQTAFQAADVARQAQALQEVIDKFAQVRPQSLDEKFGIAPENLDVEVYGEMAGALDAAGVKAELAAEALKIFEYQTGITTPTAELFTAQVDLLAQKLADGEITAADFATQMGILSNTDLEGLQALFEADIEAGNWEKISAAIQGMAGVDLSALQWMSDLQKRPGQDLSGLSRGVRHTEESTGGGGVSAFALLAQDAENALGAIETLSTDGQTHVQTFSDEATSWFETWSSESLTYIDTVDSELGNIEERIARLTMAPFVVTLSVNDPGGGAPASPSGAPRYGGRAITPFAEGGFTGVGAPNEEAGIVHKGEYVVPRGGALVLDRSASKDTPTIVVQQLNTFGDWRSAVRQLEQAAQDAGYRVKVR